MYFSFWYVWKVITYWLYITCNVYFLDKLNHDVLLVCIKFGTYGHNCFTNHKLLVEIRPY